ncbi:MAG TPA: hypothetical protein VG649_18635 [Candidatus Angelobacter sp.]|nr:hypothetical protein [Candidatus Angelobacter sp.]
MMLAAKKHSLKIILSKRESRQLLVLAILMVVAILYGLYVGWWSLHQEEERENGEKTFLKTPHEMLPSASLLMPFGSDSTPV